MFSIISGVLVIWFFYKFVLAGFLQLKKVMLILHTRERWLNMTQLSTLMYSAVQGGPMHHIVFCIHLSSMIVNIFLLIKMKRVNLSSAAQ